jgi:hypothetical protein
MQQAATAIILIALKIPNCLEIQNAAGVSSALKPV